MAGASKATPCSYIAPCITHIQANRWETAFLFFQRRAWVLSLTLSLAYGAASHGPRIRADASMNDFNDESAFLRSSTGECDALWGSWPEVQERAIADGTVMIWNMTTSVGNLMRTLMYILPVSSGCLFLGKRHRIAPHWKAIFWLFSVSDTVVGTYLSTMP